MTIEKRIKIIGFLETTFINEAVEAMERKNGRRLSNEEKLEIQSNWYKYSSSFTRMWLNYLTDEKLLTVLSKKLSLEKNLRTFNELFGNKL
ncbi:MAG: hypothetical protein A2086_01945 [Spirochaetes bacterium GWD1_27_9]|nr:MAG: hypothetical protein A2Z98_16690 [Spirochaetes bacterium GWB1_27_13]OHD24173.1 MAG: hypothetical protein A2Y34_18520 [Spirochaetes bacterium GWC1_27_15]OHD41623.1 MAG: hypothetical protein A2086_01945 [Spirochaetes bacterium GWD1_27_9]